MHIYRSLVCIDLYGGYHYIVGLDMVWVTMTFVDACSLSAKLVALEDNGDVYVHVHDTYQCTNLLHFIGAM